MQKQGQKLWIIITVSWFSEDSRIGCFIPSESETCWIRPPTRMTPPTSMKGEVASLDPLKLFNPCGGIPVPKENDALDQHRWAMFRRRVTSVLSTTFGRVKSSCCLERGYLRKKRNWRATILLMWRKLCDIWINLNRGWGLVKVLDPIHLAGDTSGSSAAGSGILIGEG
jgi:hypothetical protein